MTPVFAASDMLDWLQESSPVDLDSLDFGIVAMTVKGIVVEYNHAEAMLSGLTPSRVIGRHFFTSVAPCTNNYLIAHRFEVEETLDATIDYVFTLRMAPQPVQLRLLKAQGAALMYLLVQRRLPHAA